MRKMTASNLTICSGMDEIWICKGYMGRKLSCMFLLAHPAPKIIVVSGFRHSMSPTCASSDTQKSRHRMHILMGSSHRNLSSSFPCDFHSQSKGSISMPHGWTKVELSKLEIAALWRYVRHFNLVDNGPNPSKEQLVDVVQRHFMSLILDKYFANMIVFEILFLFAVRQMDELLLIMGFVQGAKRLKTLQMME
ncbi:histone deacetylase complex subunit SAP30 [Spatholobus suberectus]|nr:histone deacetylase complex subunit SAP30 [Spatholobus suberectus]